MKKSRSDNKAFEMSSLSAPRRVPVPVLVRDGKRCPSPSSLYHPPDYNSTIGHHPTAFTSTAAAHSVHNSLMNAAAVHSYNTSQYPTNPYNQYAAAASAESAGVHDSYLTNNNLSAAMSPTMQSSMHPGGHMAGSASYYPQLVQQNCRWPW